ncbi:MAG: TonB-dependent receptor [Bacteroidetes bacterium]|nr:TonB-dependent receptor [Bacteroidota bacterium]
MSLEELMNREVVSASKVVQKIKNVPAAIRVITSDQIRERGYFTLEETLSDLPGAQFRNMVSINSYVFLRGVPSQNNLILVLVDGIQINELNSGGFYGGGQYNLSNVERIEIVYGPASVLYGTNAVSGIINIITKDPEKNQGLNISTLYGSFNTINANLSYGYYDEEKDFGLNVSGMYKKSDKADLAGEKGDNNWTEDMENFENDYSFDTRITYKDFTAGLVFQNKQASASTYNRSVGTIFWDSGTLWNIRFINSYLRHTYNKNKKCSLTSQVYYRNATVLDNSVLVVVDTAQVGYYRPNSLIGFESIINYTPNKKFNLVGGVVFENEALAENFSKTWSNSPDERPPSPSKPNMEHNNLQSIYLQAQYSLPESVQLTAGVRFDNSSIYNQVLTTRTGLIYSKGSFTTKLLYMEAFRAPKPWDYYWGTGNPNLEPERMKSVEAILAYNISDKLRMETSIYKNSVRDKLIKDSAMEKWVNYGELKTDGLEISLDYFARKFNSYINYTYNNSYDDNGDMVPEIAKHSANVGFLYTFSNRMRINIGCNYLGSRKNPSIIPATGDNIVDQAFVLNSVLTYSNSHNLNIQLIAKNLLDTKYYHTSNRSVSRWRQPQRTILIHLSWHFHTKKKTFKNNSRLIP